MYIKEKTISPKIIETIFIMQHVNSVYVVTFTLYFQERNKNEKQKTSKFLILLMIVTLLIPAFGSVAYAESVEVDSNEMRTPVSYLISFTAANSVRGRC